MKWGSETFGLLSQGRFHGRVCLEKEKKKMEKGFDAEDERHCGGLGQISVGKQLFRVHCGSFGVISEQRSAGAWCVCNWIDELANWACYSSKGRQNPAIIWK